MSSENNQDPLDRMVVAYEKMLERVDELLEQAEKSTCLLLRKDWSMQERRRLSWMS